MDEPLTRPTTQPAEAPPDVPLVTVLAGGPSVAASPLGGGSLAVIVPCPFPANHGTPASIRELIQTQVAMGYDVHVFTYPLRDNVALCSNPNLHLHRVSMLGKSRRIKVGPMWRKLVWDLLIVLKLCRLASQHDFRLIHAYNYEGALFGWLAHLLVRRPLVIHHFNTMIDELPTYNFIRPRWIAKGLARILDYWVPRMATRIIAVSQPIVDFLHARGIRSNRIVQIPMGIDPSPFEQADGEAIRQQYGLRDEPIVMYAGLLNRFQRVDYLFEAMEVVKRERPDVRLMLVINYIEPEDKDLCDRLLARHGLESCVIITQPEPFDRVPAYLAAADVCIVPRPDCPGVPIKLLNYMAAGKPVVVPEGSSMGLRDGEEGRVVPDHDSEAMGRAILELLADDRLREHCGNSARISLKRRFSLEAICCEIGELYEELLAAEKDRAESRITGAVSR